MYIKSNQTYVTVLPQNIFEISCVLFIAKMFWNRGSFEESPILLCISTPFMKPAISESGEFHYLAEPAAALEWKCDLTHFSVNISGTWKSRET